MYFLYEKEVFPNEFTSADGKPGKNLFNYFNIFSIIFYFFFL